MKHPHSSISKQFNMPIRLQITFKWLLLIFQIMAVYNWINYCASFSKSTIRNRSVWYEFISINIQICFPRIRSRTRPQKWTCLRLYLLACESGWRIVESKVSREKKYILDIKRKEKMGNQTLSLSLDYVFSSQSHCLRLFFKTHKNQKQAQKEI